MRVAECGEREGEVVLRRRPVERDALADPFLQRLTIGGDSFLQLFGPALPLPERPERVAEIVLRLRPVERDTLPDPFLHCLTIGAHSILPLFCPAPPPPHPRDPHPAVA